MREDHVVEGVEFLHVFFWFVYFPSHPESEIESETLRLGPGNLGFNKPLCNLRTSDTEQGVDCMTFSQL